MNLEPIIQSEVSLKEEDKYQQKAKEKKKDKYHILMHIYGI